MLPDAIIDTHVHLWDPTRFPMPWLAESPALNRAYSVEQYQEQTAGLPLEALVCVEANVHPDHALQEARWLAAQAQHEPRLQGIVAFAPIEQPRTLRSSLDALVALGPQIKGVRRTIQGETAPGFCLQPAFVQGVQRLAEYGLSFDLCLTHTQLPDIIELVRRCPGTRFILDHLGKPAIREQQLDPWRAQIQELAALPNVVCKLSGMVTEADPQDWRAEDLAPFVAHILTCFGEERVMFGGDWPVLLLASPYRRWVETLAALSAQLPAQAQGKLWAENARRIYQLPA